LFVFTQISIADLPDRDHGNQTEAGIMGNNIFLIQQDGRLHAMSEQPYNNEELLQKLLEDYPELLGGDESDAASSRRFLLIAREYGVPGEENGFDRWSLDHLFVDQAGVPTLVEVKRSSDTRLRREVVGQMLDYAANAIVYWPVEGIVSKFEARCETKKLDPNQLLADFLGTEPSDNAAADAFWASVKTNLQAGKLRLVFLADKIPTELQRIVEFLNEQMDPAEVIAVELRQFVGEGVKTLVPRVFGQTASATQKKTGGTSERRRWDEDSFFAAAQEKHGLMGSELVAVRKLYDFSMLKADDIGWGTGRERGSFNPKFSRICVRSAYTVYTDGQLVLNLNWLREPAAVRCRDAILREFVKIPGLRLPPDPRFPTIPLRDWAPKVDQVIQAFKNALEI
jgi:hypothetical protein